jgi:hypothetical protein
MFLIIKIGIVHGAGLTYYVENGPTHIPRQASPMPSTLPRQPLHVASVLQLNVLMLGGSHLIR